jgi:hypothetical protein
VQSEDGRFVLRMLPGRELERGDLARRLPQGSSVTPHQVRLDRGVLGEGWREGLVRALAAIEGAVAVPA